LLEVVAKDKPWDLHICIRQRRSPPLWR
jgi:hypothetical protein